MYLAYCLALRIAFAGAGQMPFTDFYNKFDVNAMKIAIYITLCQRKVTGKN